MVYSKGKLEDEISGRMILEKEVLQEVKANIETNTNLDNKNEILEKILSENKKRYKNKSLKKCKVLLIRTRIK